jgi:hypothetical protein
VWILFVIFLDADMYYVNPVNAYATEVQCIEAHTLFMLTAPQPKINYDAICIKTNQDIGGA